jgi:hypothetical protein
VFYKGYHEGSVVEIAQQLAWLGSALRISPFGDKVAYTKPILASLSTTEVFIEYQHTPVHATEQSCWLPLFSGAVIASGFPIPKRGEEMGLEIPLELLAGIGGIQHAVEFQGGVVMKGFSQMFVPVRKTDDRVQWHAISSADSDTHLTYRDGISKCGSRALSKQVSLDDLKQCRTIVGWCSVAQSRLGSDLANYENIHYSTATDHDSSTKCAGASLGFQQFGTAALDFKFGVKEGKCHFKRDGPFRNIVSWAEKTPIVLYDTAERRGWLVNASDVMLHIVQCRHRLDPFEVAGKRITLNTSVAADSSAKEVLLKNMSVKLSDDDDHTFKTEIANIWSLLDFLIAENVSREQNNPGATVKGTLSDVLNGFEFNAVVEQHSPFRQKQTALSKTNGGWPLLSRDIDALVLLANGFEDIIVPAAERVNKDLCRSWQIVPKGKDYLATSTPMLRKLYDRAGYPLDHKYLTSTPRKLQWHQGSSMLFDACGKVNLTGCGCNRLQQIIPKSAIGTIVPPESIHNQGAVIFGHSGSMVQDMLAKPRPSVPKFSGIYSQQNVPLMPVLLQQEAEETLFSDGDTSGRSGSNLTLDSTLVSISSDTTLSPGHITSQPHEAASFATLSSCSRKRGHLPGVQVDSMDENDVLFRDGGRKRPKNGTVQNTSYLPDADSDSESADDIYDWSRPRPREITRTPALDGKPLGCARTPALESMSVGEGDVDGFRASPGDTGLSVRLAGLKSQRSLRHQSGFYQRADING